MTREQFISRVESCQRELRRFLTALCCGDTQLADDIAQEAFIKAFLASGDLKDPGNFKAWIFRIAHNCFVNNRRSHRISVDYSEALPIAAPSGADATFRYQALYAALDSLPQHERTALLLFYMEGYSVKEIAEIVEASEEAVKTRLSRGRNHLRSNPSIINDYGR